MTVIVYYYGGGSLIIPKHVVGLNSGSTINVSPGTASDQWGQAFAFWDTHSIGGVT